MGERGLNEYGTKQRERFTRILAIALYVQYMQVVEISSLLLDCEVLKTN